MAITADSTFTHVALIWNPEENRWSHLSIITDDTVSEQGHISFPIREGSDKEALLATLQEIYASATGFVDSNGDASYLVLEAQGITDFADLESNGYANPLIAGWEGREANLRQVRGTFLKEATVAKDSNTGRLDLRVSAGFVPVPRVPDGNMVVSMEDWRLISLGANFQFRIDLSPEDAFTDANVTAVAAIQAFIEWWAILKDQGDDVPIRGVRTHAEINNALRNRFFTLEQSPGSSVRWSLSALTTSAADRYMSVTCNRVSTSAAYDAQAINDLLNGLNITLSDIDDPVEKPPFGRLGNPIHTSRLYFGEHSWLELDPTGNVVHRGIGQRNHSFKMIMGYGRSVNLISLIQNSDNEFLSPRSYGIDAVHCNEEEGDRVFRFETPPEFVGVVGADRKLTIHNQNSGFTVEVLDWNGHNLLTLLPTEKVTFRVTWRPDGSGELINELKVDRIFRLIGVNAVSFTATKPIDVGNNLWGRPFPIPTYDDQLLSSHEEVFARSNVSDYESQDAIADVDLFVFQSVKVSKGGSARINFSTNIRSGTSGWIPSGNGPQLWRQRGNNRTLLRAPEYRGFGSYDNVPLEFDWDNEIQENDVFLPIFAYAKDGTTMDMNGINSASYRFEINLEQLIYAEYTP